MPPISTVIGSTASFVSNTSILLCGKLTRHSYNASVFKIVIANDYAIFAVDTQSDRAESMASRPDLYYKLDNVQWKQIYDQEYISGHGDLFLAIDQLAFSTSPIVVSLNMSDYLPWTTDRSFYQVVSDSPEWISFIPGNVTTRTESDGPSQLPQGSDSGRKIEQLPISMHVAHAYSARAGPRSCVQISLYFMIVVITFNTLKLTIMVYVLITDRSKYVVTLGDAAASFLECPDPVTKGVCMLTRDKHLFSRGHPSLLSSLGSQYTRDLSIHSNNIWQPRPQRYFSSVRFDKISSAILA